MLDLGSANGIVSAMPRRASVPEELTRGPFTVAEAAAAGVTAEQLRGSAYRRLIHGVYVCAPLADDGIARLSAIAARLPPGCAFCGPTAAQIRGIDLRVVPTVVEVHAPIGVGVWPRRGVRVRHGPLDPNDITRVNGLPVTSTVRTTFDLARSLPLLEAVAAVDAALHRRLLTERDLADYITWHPKHKGAARAERVLGLADARAESPMESVLRATLVLGGLPRPECQVRLHDADGFFIGRVDLYYPERRLVVEYDGAGHRDTLVVDLRRQNELISAGHRLLRFSYADVVGRPRAVVAKVWAELATDRKPVE